MPEPQLKQPRVEAAEGSQTSWRLARAGSVRVAVAGDVMTRFVETWPLIEAMVRDVRAAHTRIWLETYIFYDDAAGRAVAAALRERAAAGVQVRVLYDAIGSKDTSWTFFRELEQAGVQVHAFHSVRE